MVKISTALIFVFFALSSWTQSLNWGRSIGGLEWESCTKMKETTSGDILRCGRYFNTVDFDPGVGVTNMTSNGNGDCFIEKTDTTGNLIWVKSFGGIGSDLCADMVVDVDRNIYLFGSFNYTVDFDPGVGIVNKTSIDDSDGFVLKLDENGNFIWVKIIEGANDESLRFATIGNDNDIYFCGTYKDTIDFDPGIGVSESISNGMNDIFIEKIDSAGNFIWGYGIGGVDDDVSSQLAFDNNGFLYTAGNYEYTVDFDPGVGVMNSSSLGNTDRFVLKLDTAGTYIWHHSIGGSGSDYSTSFCNDNDGNIYSTGWYYNTVDFDPGPGMDYHTSSAGGDFFLQKFTPSGEMVWTTVIEGTDSEYAQRIVSKEEYLYLSGVFNGTTDFDPTPGIDSFTSMGGNDGFLMKMDTVGNRLWTRHIGGPGNGGIENLLISSTDEIYIGGTFQDSIDIDPGIGVNMLVSNGMYDLFLTKLHNDPCSNFSLVIDSMSDISCSSDGYSYTSSLYGTSPIIYTWNTVPVTNTSSAVFDIAGLYELTAVDSNNCLASANLIVSGSSEPLAYDLNSDFLSLEFRPGFISSIWVDVFNAGCVPQNGQLKLVLDPQTSYLTASITPNQIIGDTLIWDFPTMSYDSIHFVPKVQVMTNVGAVIGDTVCFNTILTPIIGDGDTLNNNKTYCYPIVNAYDPNDKQVYPQGDCSDHFIVENQRLTYKVRFQNTGNSHAINVVVKDTISALLDINTVQIVSQSHEPLVTTVLPGNVLNFSFPNINLADSTSNEDESHGFVIFEISPIVGISDGAVIENKVEIYFDYNPEVVTNTVFNTIQSCAQFAVNVDLSATDFCEGDLLTGTSNGAEECYDFSWQLDTLITSNLGDFNWQSDTSGTFDLIVSKSNSICFEDSIINIVIHPKQASESIVFQCEGDSLFVGGGYQFLSGIYIDTLQTTFGCDSIVTTTLENHLLPIVSLAAFDPDTVCSFSGNLSLPIASPMNGVYSGDAIGLGLFDVSLGQIGINYVMYTFIDSNNCVNSDSTSIVINDCAGIDLLELNDFEVYPNPTSGSLEIQSDIDVEKVFIFNTHGALLQTESSASFSVEKLPGGVYIIHVETNDKILISRFVKD